jgi:hypothetical protein
LVNSKERIWNPDGNIYYEMLDSVQEETKYINHVHAATN